MNRYVFLTLIATAIAATAAVVDSRTDQAAPAEAPPAVLPSSISALGIVEGATEEIALRTEVTGVVVERLTTVGAWVEQGQPLLRLDDRLAQSRVVGAEASLAAAVARRDLLIEGAHELERREADSLRRAAAARLTQAETTFQRLEQLRAKNAIPAQDSDDARSLVHALQAELSAAEAHSQRLSVPARPYELKLAEARVAQAEASLETARVALDKTVLRSSSAGQVLDIDAEPGELISPTDAAPAVVLADTRSLRVRAYIEELDAPRLRVGSQAVITADGIPTQAFRGVVASLSPRMAVKHNFSELPNELYDTKVREAMIDLADQHGLLIGLRVEVRVEAIPEESTE